MVKSRRELAVQGIAQAVLAGDGAAAYALLDYLMEHREELEGTTVPSTLEALLPTISPSALLGLQILRSVHLTLNKTTYAHLSETEWLLLQKPWQVMEAKHVGEVTFRRIQQCLQRWGLHLSGCQLTRENWRNVLRSLTPDRYARVVDDYVGGNFSPYHQLLPYSINRIAEHCGRTVEEVKAFVEELKEETLRPSGAQDENQ